MGAGILPVTISKGTILFLLAKESNLKYWSDFGGSSKKYETKFDTAIREGYEELDGFLGNKQELTNRVNNNFIEKIEIDKYSTYLFYVKYDKIKYLPYYFNNQRNFLKNYLTYIPTDGIFEKSEVKLFSKSDLIINEDIIRPFYRDVTYELLNLNICDILKNNNNKLIY